MGEQKETIDVRRVHDNDKYVINVNLKEEVNGDRLLQIYAEVQKGLDDIKQQLEDIPKQLAERQKYLKAQYDKASRRLEAFGEHARKLKPKEPEVEIVDSDTIQKKPESS